MVDNTKLVNETLVKLGVTFTEVMEFVANNEEAKKHATDLFNKYPEQYDFNGAILMAYICFK